MNIYKKIQEYFRQKTPEQVFSFCLFVGCFILMLFCAIVRLCGGLWFTADTSQIEEPSKLLQDIIMGALMVFEATFVYKILCRTNWIWCILIAIGQLLLVYFAPNTLVANIINVLAYYVVAILFRRNWVSLIETTIIYLLGFAYSALFLVGRIGFIDGKQAYDFVTGVLTSIDLKLFIVSIYLFIKNFGGIKLWKNVWIFV